MTVDSTARSPSESSFPDLVGAVLCGGKSLRFGSDKALAPAGDVMMGQRVVNAIRGAGIDPVVAVGGTAGSRLGLVTVADRWPGQGPLGGLATILWWARQGDVLVVPCDLPLLSESTVLRLVNERTRIRLSGSNDAIVATVDGEPRHSLAIWPAANGRAVRQLLEAGERRYRSALEVTPWVPVEVPADRLSDADTPGQLRDLLE